MISENDTSKAVENLEKLGNFYALWPKLDELSKLWHPMGEAVYRLVINKKVLFTRSVKLRGWVSNLVQIKLHSSANICATHRHINTDIYLDVVS